MRISRFEDNLMTHVGDSRASGETHERLRLIRQSRIKSASCAGWVTPLINSISSALCWQYYRGLYNVNKYEHTDKFKSVMVKTHNAHVKNWKKPFWKRLSRNIINYYLKNGKKR